MSIYANYCGCREINSLLTSQTTSRSIEEKVIEDFENSFFSERRQKIDNKTSINISKQGLKLKNVENGDILLRIALLELVLFVTYNDGFGRTNGIILEKNSEITRSHLIQFFDDSSSIQMSKMINDLFQEAEEAKNIVDVNEPPSPY